MNEKSKIKEDDGFLQAFIEKWLRPRQRDIKEIERQTVQAQRDLYL